MEGGAVGLRLKDPIQLMQKTYLFSVQIEMPHENALKSVGYTDTVPTLGYTDTVHTLSNYW